MTEYMNHEPMDSQEELVDCCFGCPRCGERRMDELVWIDDDHVECQSCQQIYEPQP